MGQEAWNTIRKTKGFYVRIYRKAGTYAVVSVGINFFLGLMICYHHFREPTPNFYATSGIVPPVRLFARTTPNYLPTALLAPDPVSGNNKKVIPQ